MPKLEKDSPREKRWSLWLFAAILLLFAIYATVFILRTSIVVDGERYFALFDDAMISMQYARNLANGDGLVYSAGDERVEGFSNPLCAFYMALFHLFPIASSKISLAIQISGALFLFANLFVVKKIAERISKSNWLVPILAVFLTAFYFPLNNWSLQGTEVSILTLFLSISVLKSLGSLQDGSFSKTPYLLLALGTWVRFDMLVPMIALTLFMVWKDEKNRRLHLQWGFGLLAAATAVQTILRFWYYDEWLPNTYYLKVVGVSLFDRVKRGLAVFGQFLWVPGWAFLLLPSLLVLVWPESSTLLMLALLAGQAAYSIYVGGDAWEHKGGANRFIAIAMPLFFVLFMQTLEKLRATFLTIRSNRWLVPLSHMLLALFAVASLFNLNTLRENYSFEKWALIRRPIFVAGNERYLNMGLMLNSITDTDATVALATAGNIAYFSERYSIDLLGKADKVIARSAPHESGGSFNNVEDIFRPGHNKWDYEHSIAGLQPDIIAQVWGDSSELEPYLQSGNYIFIEVQGFPLYLRADSEHILWDLISDQP
jgi:hypothetical protein